MPSADNAAAPPAGSDGRRTIGRLPANLGRGTIGVFNRDNLVPLLIGGAAAGGASFLDGNGRDAVSNPGAGFGKTLETGGGVLVRSIFVVGIFAGGRFSHGRFRAMTYDLLDAAIVNFGYTALLKVAIKRERPNGQDNKSFPSGHTSNAFTLATVVERHYGWKLGVPAYAVAAAMGYSRLVQDKHHLSDVVAGATLGYIVGRTVVRVNGQPLPAKKQVATWNVFPILAQNTRGLRMSVAF